MSSLFRLGLVLPHTANRATAWLNGWRLAAPPRTVETALGLSTATRPALALARALLRDYRADALVGWLEPAEAAQLAPDLAEWQTPLLCVHAGSWRTGPANPWVTHLTAQAWQCQWTLGAWAAHAWAAPTHGPSAALVLAADLPEDEAVALARGFEAHGGHITTTYRWQGAPTLAALQAERAQHTFDVVLAATPAEALADLAALGLPVAHAHPLAPATGYAFAATWQAGWPMAENAAFVRLYERTYGMPPTVWAMLGYEAGLRVAHSLAWGARTGEVLKQAWHAAAPVGPRPLTWEASSGAWLAPVSLSTPETNHTPTVGPIPHDHPALSLWRQSVGG